MKHWLAALLPVLVGCGGPLSAAFVRVEAPLLVPAESNAFEVTVRRADDGQVVLQRHYDLVALNVGYPLEFPLSTDNSANLGDSSLRVEGRALLDSELSQPWSVDEEPLSLFESELSRVVLRLCDCQ